MADAPVKASHAEYDGISSQEARPFSSHCSRSVGGAAISAAHTVSAGRRYSSGCVARN
ncbi:MAG: hypothetical protein R2705_21765 [Ilumatobacteraceae bacterium]